MVELAPIHVIGICASLVLLAQSVRLARAGKENVLEFLLWSSFGAVLLLYTLARVFTPVTVVDAIDSTLISLGFGSGERGLLVLSTISLFLVVLYTYTLTKTNDKRLNDAQREVALLRYELEQLDGESRETEANGRETDPTGENE